LVAQKEWDLEVVGCSSVVWYMSRDSGSLHCDIWRGIEVYELLVYAHHGYYLELLGKLNHKISEQLVSLGYVLVKWISRISKNCVIY